MSQFYRRVSRRRLLRSTGFGACGLALAYLLGCGEGAEAPSPARPSPALPALGWQRLESPGDVPGPRRDHSLSGSGDSGLFVFGGRAADAVLDDLWFFDVEAAAWTQLKPADKPPARFGHNALVISTQRQRPILYVFAGQNGSVFFDDLWAYDIASGEWQEVRADGGPPSGRYGAASTLDGNGRWIISHGFATAGQLDDTWAFDPGENQWTDISPSGRRPVGRSLMRSSWDGGKERLLLFGGQSTSAPFLADQWKLQGDSWIQIDVRAGPSPRHSYAAAFDAAVGGIILVGGRTESGPANDVWVFDSETDAWGQPSVEGEQPAPRYGHDAAWLESQRSLFVSGGSDGTQELNDLWKLTAIT